MAERTEGILLGTVSQRLAAMSTMELCANLRLTLEGEGDFQGVVPTARLLHRMESEWLERPLRDRVVAQARMDAILHEVP